MSKKTREIENRQESKRTPDGSQPLILDLIGPFVVHFCQPDSGQPVARIHAPLCLDHHANILTDSDDISLFGLFAPDSLEAKVTLIAKRQQPVGKGWVYGFAAGTAPMPGKKHYYNRDQVLVSSPATRKSSNTVQIPEENCHLVFEVPIPDTVVGLHSERIWIHRNGADMWVNPDIISSKKKKSDSSIVDSDRARALRFVYKDCATRPKLAVIRAPSKSHPDLTLTPETLGSQPSPHYHITLRFWSNRTTPDNHHEDAFNCFQTMRNLVADAKVWRVDFDDLAEPCSKIRCIENVGGPHPLDCGGAVITVDDVR